MFHHAFFRCQLFGLSPSSPVTLAAVLMAAGVARGSEASASAPRGAEAGAGLPESVVATQTQPSRPVLPPGRQPAVSGAFRTPEVDLNVAPLATVTASSVRGSAGERMEPSALVDRRFGNDSKWAAELRQKGKPWVQFEFSSPRQLRAMRLYWLPGYWGMGARFPAFRVLVDRGRDVWLEVFVSPRDHGTAQVNDSIYAGRTVRFVPATASRWRIEALDDGAAMALREVELFDEVPPFRTRDREPGDTRLRLREWQKAAVAKRQGEAVLWATGSMEKVFRDDRLENLAEVGAGPLIVCAARGETEAFQVVWWSTAGADHVTASLDHLRGPTAGAEGWVTVGPVSYVYCRVATTDLRMSVQGLDRFYGPGFYPEVLEANRPVSVHPGQHQPFWISVAIPRDAAPGTYEGRVTVRCEKESITLPFELRVWDFALPEPSEFAVRNVFTFSGYDAKTRTRHCSDEASFQAYWRNLRKTAATMPGACFSSLDPAPVRRDASDQLSYDWAPFDQQVEWCRQQLGVRHFILPFDYLAYHEQLFSPTAVIGPGVVAGSARWFALLEQALSRYVEHLRARSWFGEFSFFIYDEPDNRVLPECRRLVELARRVDPALQLILHSHPWTSEMVALDSTAVLNPRHYSLPFVEKLQARGWKIWTYCNGASVIDGPPNASRMIPWLYFKQGITGMTWHSLDDWGVTSPWEAPDRYLSWNAASCFFFPDPADPIRALRTIRWEQWRDGMEDFEFLRRLRDDARHSRDVALQTQASTLLNRAAALAGVYGYPDSLRDEQVFIATTRPRSALTADQRSGLLRLNPLIEYRDNPAEVEALRRQIGNLIERLNR